MKDIRRTFTSLATLAIALLVGCGGDSSTMTKGEFCSKIGAATCDRAVACAINTSAQRAKCVSDFQSTCCESSLTCTNTPTNATAAMQANQIVAACPPALATFDCTELSMGHLPTACTSTTAGALTATAREDRGAVATPDNVSETLGQVSGRSFSTATE